MGRIISEDWLHLTSGKNIKSILKNGILPSPISLSHHLEVFKKDGLIEDKCVYVWNGETYKNTKFIKDMIYTKLFIHPRNDIYEQMPIDFNYKKFGKQLYGKESFFYLLRISDFDNNFGNYIHTQEPGEGTLAAMDDKYAHDDKPLAISEIPIKPTQFEIVERINIRMYKNNTLGFSFSKTIY